MPVMPTVKGKLATVATVALVAPVALAAKWNGLACDSDPPKATWNTKDTGYAKIISIPETHPPL